MTFPVKDSTVFGWRDDRAFSAADLPIFSGKNSLSIVESHIRMPCLMFRRVPLPHRPDTPLYGVVFSCASTP